MASNDDEVTATLRRVRLVPVVVLDAAASAAPLGRALVDGGVPVAEVTFRTDAAAEAIAVLAGRHDLLVGAGTVLGPDQVDRAVDAGARFVVSPGFSAAVVQRCLDRDVPVFPGAATATEIQAAHAAGLRTVKFFPAEAAGGLAALAALAAPFGMMSFIPTGGITAANAAPYLRHPAVTAIGGSWMVARELVRQSRFDEIERLTREAARLASTSAAGR